MQVENHRYTIQGVDVLAIAEQFGLPLYVYDAEKISEKIDLLRSSFSGLTSQEINLKIKYAAKALTNVSILKLMRLQGIDIEVVSINEARMAQLAGFAPEQIMFTPSGNSWSEIQTVIGMGLLVNVDSLPLLEQIGQTYGDQCPVALRINPQILDGGNFKISTGHADSKFGISSLQRSEINRIVTHYGIPVVGLHVHSGSDFNDADTFLKGADVLFDLAFDYPDIQFIDFGSGFKVAYKPGDHYTDIPTLGAKISDAFLDFCARYGRNPDLCFEPGKLLVSESGHLLVSVNVVKENPARTFIQVDSGLNHLIRPMMYDAWHDIKNISNPPGPGRGEEEQRYTVVGYICETDTFATDRLLPTVRPGDVLSFENAGAYGFSMASNYNARCRPAEVLVYDGKPYLIRQRETFDDLLRGQEIIDFKQLTDKLVNTEA